MFKLPEPTAANIKRYYDQVIERVKKARDVSLVDPAVKAFLTDAKLKEIITDPPRRLLSHHNAVIPLLQAGFSMQGYDDYLAAKKKRRNRTHADNAIIALYEPQLEELFKIFDYEKFITKHKITSFLLAELQGQNTCTYCNRLYTLTVVVVDESTGNVNDSSRLIRPTFDHWYSHSRYPVLGLSFFNLIPICSVCNSSVKTAIDFSLSKHIHPYVKDDLQTFSFNYKLKNVHSNNVALEVKARSKMANTLKAFRIQEIYDAHSEFELKDLLELRYKYSENYLDTLFHKTFHIPISQKEAYRMIFGVEFDDAHHFKRPFSKFKKDILVRLGIKIK